MVWAIGLSKNRTDIGSTVLQYMVYLILMSHYGYRSNIGYVIGLCADIDKLFRLPSVVFGVDKRIDKDPNKWAWSTMASNLIKYYKFTPLNKTKSTCQLLGSRTVTLTWQTLHCRDGPFWQGRSHAIQGSGQVLSPHRRGLQTCLCLSTPPDPPAAHGYLQLGSTEEQREEGWGGWCGDVQHGVCFHD